ncbi:MAG: TIGR00725 family protein [Deltaproteobacteria bacterium]|nr:MAG: TIGR00725 family protein [Deltaproteobacteria bacterium]
MAPLQRIAVIGPNDAACPRELYDFGVELGTRIAAPHRAVVCGGMGGLMEAVCKGVKISGISCLTVGILPHDTPASANPFIDLPIPTGLGIGRNLVIIHTAEIVIAAGGGAGTLSELAFAWQRGKTVLCVTRFAGWARELAGRALDRREGGRLIPVGGIDEILVHLPPPPGAS